MILMTLLAIAFLLGTCLGICISKIMVERRIERADICSDDKRFLKDVLGIPQD
jgi:hypothetical protein